MSCRRAFIPRERMARQQLPQRGQRCVKARTGLLPAPPPPTPAGEGPREETSRTTITIYIAQVGCGRATRPCAARTRPFRRIYMYNRTLRDHPRPSLYNCLPVRLIVYLWRKSATNPSLGKIRKPIEQCWSKRGRVNKAFLMLIRRTKPLRCKWYLVKECEASMSSLQAVHICFLLRPLFILFLI
jgi:hypothetical protein